MRHGSLSRTSWLALAASLLFASGCVPKSKYVKEQSRATDLETQLAQAKKSNEDLNQQLQTSQQNLQATQQNLQTTQQTADELAKQKAEQDKLVQDLANEIQSDQVKITNIAGKLSINMVDKILFGSGSAQLKDDGKKVLDKIGSALKKIEDKRIWVGGHTDNVAISPTLRDTFATNWELSSARATAVVRYLQDKDGIPGERLLAVGLSEYQPIGDNKLPEGRAQNRRIEILLIPTQDTLKTIHKEHS